MEERVEELVLKVSQLRDVIPEWTIVFWRTVEGKKLAESEFIYKRHEFADKDVIAIQPSLNLISSETYTRNEGLVITLSE